MSLRAIVMAGGEGTRLRPMTENLPKPLVPLLEEPVMGYTLKLLRRHGIQDIGVTLWYQPKKVRAAFRDGEKYGVKLKYYEEVCPLGTAGSVRMAKEELTDTFFVLSGDGLTDCDLTAALRFHREKKALATIVLHRTDIPLPYGVVMRDQDGRITGFLEKPGWSRVFSDLVNTGIYILEPEVLERIPAAGSPDFGKDIFPALLSAGLPLYGWEMPGYWCDVGAPEAYLSAQRALLKGDVDLPVKSGIHPDVRMESGAVTEGNCRIGHGARIGAGAVIRDSVIGEGCVIGAGAVAENCCLWAGSVLREKARASGSVLCRGASVGCGAVLAPGCVLGEEARVGAFAELLPGVTVAAHLRTAPGAVVRENIVTAAASAPRWNAQGALWENGGEISALCGAFLQTTGAKEVLVARQGEEAPALMAAGALALFGAHAVIIGPASLPMAALLIPALGLDGGVFCENGHLQLLDASGQPLDNAKRTKMDACMQLRTFPPLGREAPVTRLTGAEEIYLSHILPPRREKPLFSPVAVFCDTPLLLHLAERGLRRMNARTVRFGEAKDMRLEENEVGFWLSPDGRKCSLFTRAATPPAEQQTLLLLSLCGERNGCLYDLPGVPRAAERLLPLRHPDGGEACRFQRHAMGDGLLALLLFCGALKDGTPRDLFAPLPQTHILSREITCERREKGRLLHEVCDRSQLPRTLGEGVRIRHDRGCATIIPDAHRDVVRVVSESANSEFARELCDFYEREITALLDAEKSSCSAP